MAQSRPRVKKRPIYGRQDRQKTSSTAAVAQTREQVTSDQQTHGGYDYEFVGTIPSKYICSICTKVVRDAHLAVCCGQHFCASCLIRRLDTQKWRKTCPHCQQKNFQHVLNKAMIREVHELKIHCTNHSEGCGWAGELEGLKNHLDSDKGCSYTPVSCSNKGCGEKVRRKDLQAHLLKKCYYRPYACEHCGHKDTYTAIAGCGGHYSVCPEFSLACPNRCGGTGIRRRAMPHHCSSCPLEPLDCPFKDAGCSEKIARKDMEDHMTTNQQKHMIQGYLYLQQANQQLKQELHSTKQELHDTKQELHDVLDKGAVGLYKTGDVLTFRVRDFPQLMKEKKVWQSRHFSIGGKIRVRLEVYPRGVGRGEGSHVSVSLVLAEVVKKKEDMWLEYDVSITPTMRCWHTLILCTTSSSCSNHFPFPSPGEVLLSDELFLQIKEANSVLVNDLLTLKLQLKNHTHNYPQQESYDNDSVSSSHGDANDSHNSCIELYDLQGGMVYTVYSS